MRVRARARARACACACARVCMCARERERVCLPGSCEVYRGACRGVFANSLSHLERLVTGLCLWRATACFFYRTNCMIDAVYGNT